MSSQEPSSHINYSNLHGRSRIPKHFQGDCPENVPGCSSTWTARAWQAAHIKRCSACAQSQASEEQVTGVVTRVRFSLCAIVSREQSTDQSAVQRYVQWQTNREQVASAPEVGSAHARSQTSRKQAHASVSRFRSKPLASERQTNKQIDLNITPDNA